MTTKQRTPSTPTDPWEEAFLRVEAYLLAWKVEPRSLVAEIATAICKKAQALAAQNEGMHPVQLAMSLLQDSLSDRFREVFPDTGELPHHHRARGRLAVLLCGAAPLLGKQLPTSDSCPPELCSALRQSFLQSGPELRLSKMAPAPIEFGFGDSDEVAPSARHWMPNPALVVTLLVMSALGGVLAAAAAH